MGYKADVVSAPVLTALMKGLEKQIKGTKIDAGTHEINCTLSVRVFGTLEKSEDSVRQMPPGFDWPLMLTLLCSKAKLGRDEAKKLIADCAQSAIALEGDDSACPERLKDRFLDSTTALDQVKDANRVTKSYGGATKFLGTVNCE